MIAFVLLYTTFFAGKYGVFIESNKHTVVNFIASTISTNVRSRFKFVRLSTKPTVSGKSKLTPSATASTKRDAGKVSLEFLSNVFVTAIASTVKFTKSEISQGRMISTNPAFTCCAEAV